MGNSLFVFIINILGGIVLFYLGAFVFGSIFGLKASAAMAVGIFLFIQLCFVTTLIFRLMHRVKLLEKNSNK